MSAHARFDEVGDLGWYETLMRINLWGAVWCTHAALPHLKRTRGRIVATASLAGLVGVPGRTAYSASKFALVGFFEALRTELMSSGVSVTIAFPGVVATETRRRGFDAAGRAAGTSGLDERGAMSAETCARLIVEATAARRRNVVMTARGKLGRWLKLIAPGLVDRMAIAALRREARHEPPRSSPVEYRRAQRGGRLKSPASPWVVRWAALVAPAGTVLDVAAGNGRHSAFFASRGHAVTAVDRDAVAMVALGGIARTVVADLEAAPWPFGEQTFDAVVVTNYLWRPLWPQIVAAVAPGGVMICETFAIGNETVGRPTRADFLLAPGELLAVAAGLRIVAYENGFLSSPDRFVQRICAVREDTPPTLRRFPLDAPAALPRSLESIGSGNHE